MKEEKMVKSIKKHAKKKIHQGVKHTKEALKEAAMHMKKHGG